MGKKAASKAKPRARGAVPVQQSVENVSLSLTDAQRILVEKIQSKGLAGLSKSDREMVELYGPVLVAAFPKVRYLECAGRQSRTVIDQGKRHELPYGTAGKTVDLRSLIRWVHDFLARHGQALNSKSSLEDDAFKEADAQLKRDIALEGLQQRKLANREKELNIDIKSGKYLPVAPMQELFAELGGLIQQTSNEFRGTGTIQKSKVLKLFNEMLDNFERVAEEKLGSGGDSDKAA